MVVAAGKKNLIQRDNQDPSNFILPAPPGYCRAENSWWIDTVFGEYKGSNLHLLSQANTRENKMYKPPPRHSPTGGLSVFLAFLLDE